MPGRMRPTPWRKSDSVRGGMAGCRVALPDTSFAPNLTNRVVPARAGRKRLGGEHGVSEPSVAGGLSKSKLLKRYRHDLSGNQTPPDLKEWSAPKAVGAPSAPVPPGVNSAPFQAADRCLLRYTSNCEIAAGVMPGMRLAWSMVAGRERSSFSVISADSPLTVP